MQKIYANTMLILLRSVFNAIIFYIGWIACIAGAAHGRVWEALFLTFFLMSMDLYFTKITSSSVFYQDLILMAVLTISGSLIEMGLIYLKVIEYASPNALNPFIPPLWIMTLYALFALSLNHSLAWLKGKFVIGMGCGALFGPLSYLAGVRLGGAIFLLPVYQTLGILGSIWALYVPCSSWLAFYLNKRRL
jgi:hypothetical protein